LLALLILASARRHAVPTLCPTNEQILAAVRQRDDAVVQEVSNQAAQDDPSSVVLVHSERIKRISDVLCSDELPNDLPGNPITINCAFVVRYWTKDAHTMARMVRRSNVWEIDDALSVTRERR
jgi:hypothetical protein